MQSQHFRLFGLFQKLSIFKCLQYYQVAVLFLGFFSNGFVKKLWCTQHSETALKFAAIIFTPSKTIFRKAFINLPFNWLPLPCERYTLKQWSALNHLSGHKSFCIPLIISYKVRVWCTRAMQSLTKDFTKLYNIFHIERLAEFKIDPLWKDPGLPHTFFYSFKII